MASLSLKLFGEFQAHLGDQLLPGFRTNKVQALLVYLVVESGRHNREMLMELLWPGMPERSARHNLRQILYNLRGTISEVDSSQDEANKMVSLVLTNRHMLRLNPEAAVSADVKTFKAHLETVQSHDHIDLLGCPVCKAELEAAVSYYKGEFLADFYLVDSNEFEDWAQITRQFFRRKVLDALEILTTMAIREKDYPKAKERAEHQLEIDNLRESSYRQLMEILALSGHREEALSVYESCRRMLREELAMQPAKRTTETYEKILAGDLSFDRRPVEGVRGYELKEEIGAGAQGAIHRAVQTAVGREVAVKVINPRFANDPEFIRRFEDEAQIIARLEHPFVVPLYDYWRDGDGTYLVMRYLKGGNLLSALENGPWNVDMTVKMLDQVSSALATAHQMGIVHRDIKPANILFDVAGNAYLSDFGIAKNADRNLRLTDPGDILGTPDYISPEQILAEEVGPASDIYSLGAVLYETLTGEKPFGDSTVANLIYKHINEPLPRVIASRPDLPPDIDTVIQKATAKDPKDRYGDPLALAEAFRQTLTGGESAVLLPAPLPLDIEVYNPYKGLRPFQEADADDFFGRDSLVDRLIERLSNDTSGVEHQVGSGRFIALVGPSGSGKSSAIKAGLLPALRADAVPGSKKWFVAEMVPGTHPLEELELALWPIAVDAPPSLVEPMERDVRGMLRTIRRILPDEDTGGSIPQLLLIIDQFEELFTLVEDNERRTFFLDSLMTAISAHRSPLRVVITMRADFYDRPLQYQSLGQLIKYNTEVVLPMTTEELTWAIREPARHVGITLEEGVVEEAIADVSDQPGGLPLLQYALTELFERRHDNILTKEAYREIGGIHGALGRRAETLYSELDHAGQEIARQLFLRLVTLGEGAEDTRRRVLRSELEEIAYRSNQEMSEQEASEQEAKVAGGLISDYQQKVAGILDQFGKARLLTFDRDALTRNPTVEVAHEALLREWPRLRGWLVESRDDVRQQRLLAQSAAEWLEANKDESYLLRGTRLSQFEGWIETSRVALTADESGLLEKSVAGRKTRQAEEDARRQRELETAQKLAETEKARAETESQRAEEQQGAARRFRRLAAVLALVLVGAIVLAYLAFQSSQEASRERANSETFAQLSRSRELAAEANNNLDVDPELSILLALEALNINQTAEAENALHQALLTSRLRQRLTIQTGPIQRVAYSSDGSRIATGSFGQGQAIIWDAAGGEMLHQIPIGGCCLGLYFDQSGQYLAAVESNDSLTIGVWNVASGEKEKSITLPISTFDISNYALAPDWSQVAVGYWSGQLETWAVDSEEILFELSGHEGPMELEYSQDGRRLVSMELEIGRVIVWDSQTGEALRSFVSGVSMNDHTVSPDGRFVALATALAATIEIWDMDSTVSDEELEPMVTLPGHQYPISLLNFSSDGTRLASTGRDRTARIWDVISGEQLIVLNHAEIVRSAVFNPSGDRLLTGDLSGIARVWDITPQGTAERLAMLAHDEVKTAVISPDGSQLFTGGWDGLGKLWDTETGELRHTLEGHSEVIFVAAFHPGGQQVATASTDGTVRIWDTQSGQALMTLEGHEPGDVGGLFTGVLGVSYNPEGDRLASVGADGTLRIWDANNGSELSMIRAGSGLINVKYSPDGKYLLHGSDFGMGIVFVRDAETLTERMAIQTNRQVWALDISPDARFLATAGEESTVELWALDLESQESEHLATLEGQSTTPAILRFSPDGRLLASANLTELRLWDISTLNDETDNLFIPQLLFLPGGSGTDFSPDGLELVSGGLDGIMRFYLLDVVQLVDLAQERSTRDFTEQECQRYLHLPACP